MMTHGPLLVKLGPVGPYSNFGYDTDRDEDWDDINLGEVKQIILSYQGSASGISSIQFGYQKEGGGLILSPRRGTTKYASHFHVVALQPDEQLEVFEGHIAGCRVNDLTFETNKGKYGPYGNTTEEIIGIPHRKFLYSCRTAAGNGPAKVVSFHGTMAGCVYVKAMGVHIKTDSASDA